MGRETDTGTIDADEKSFVEGLMENMREQRIRFMGVLEREVESGNMHLLEAVRTFSRGTLMDPAKVEHWLHQMSGPDSCFKRIQTFKEYRRG